MIRGVQMPGLRGRGGLKTSTTVVAAGGGSASTVSSIVPSGGSSSGGEAVTVTGTGFTSLANSDVTIGGSNVNSLALLSSTQFTCVTPAHAAGVVDVVVAGVGTSNQLYKYATPIVEELFDYANAAELLSDPDAIWNTGEGVNTSRITIATDVSYAGNSKSMKYTWPNPAGVDYSIRPGMLEIPDLAEIWVAFVTRNSSNFTLDGPETGQEEYKVAGAMDLDEDGRWNIPEMQSGQLVFGYPDTISDTAGFDLATFSNNTPHLWLCHLKCSTSGGGILRVSLDGTTKVNRTGITTTHTKIDAFVPGLNMNQGCNTSNMFTAWHVIRVYNTDPGWTF